MIVAIYSVFCDRRECGAWIAQEKTRLHARRVAKDYGWTRKLQGDRIIDLCPECSGPDEVR